MYIHHINYNNNIIKSGNKVVILLTKLLKSGTKYYHFLVYII
jgi:hypothetical protein